jgi:hypothetical protein
MKSGKNNLFSRAIKETQNEIKLCYDLFTGKKKQQCLQEIAKVNQQIYYIEKGLNSSLSFSPQQIDIIR